MTSTLTWAARSLALGIAVSGFAQASMAQSASGVAPMATPASGAKMKKPMKARVTGGPGYVSESSATPASAASAPMAMPMKRKARVTGGPGGTAGTPDASTGK